MTIILILIVGGIIGWLASMLMRTDGQQGIILNVVVGIVGAILGNLLAGPLLGIDTTIQTFNLPGFLVAIVGAIILLGIVNLVQRKRIR